MRTSPDNLDYEAIAERCVRRLVEKGMAPAPAIDSVVCHSYFAGKLPWFFGVRMKRKLGEKAEV